MGYKISPESALLAAICIVDMVLTITLVKFRLAVEQNPLMAACLSKGVLTFVAIKILSFTPFIIVAELHRRRNPAFVRAATRMAIFLYLGIYTAILVRVNFLA
ncbi:MAG: DUF5658 family protein [Armatimonadota bacterium]|nr:DUF5658 family protein [Armatimonadota bacterium]